MLARRAIGECVQGSFSSGFEKVRLGWECGWSDVPAMETQDLGGGQEFEGCGKSKNGSSCHQCIPDAKFKLQNIQDDAFRRKKSSWVGCKKNSLGMPSINKRVMLEHTLDLPCAGYGRLAEAWQGYRLHRSALLAP